MRMSLSAKTAGAVMQVTCNAEKYRKEYDRSRFIEKLSRVARYIGSKAVFSLLVMFYATLDKSIPFKARATLLAVLGYFVSPIDVIPDALPLLGFADDMAAVSFVLRQIWNNLNKETVSKARRRMRQWFPDEANEEFAPDCTGMSR